GALLEHLARAKQVDARGLELSQAGVNACVARGLSVVQGDADTDLRDYPDAAFDYAILSQTIQAMHEPKAVLEQAVRIARRTIVSLPNFGHWTIRLALGLRGRMPLTRALNHAWYETPNIHLCTVADFAELVRTIGLKIETAIALDASGKASPLRPHAYWDNLVAESAILCLHN
ncbi:MAG TPA: methionine biosynthesis protein MetW, partial [Alphaproteobacteria bacterium]|nr:methionine biosynthesis protein MetW [Alphaproteobacteria bacterium]